MAVTRCPHCQAPLPEPEESGAFCTSCGRRVAGWKKAPQRAGDSAPLVDGNAVTRRAEASDVEAALAAAARRSSAERRAAEQADGEGDEEEADEGGLIDPAATVKLEPTSASKVTDQRPAAPGDDASVSAELAALRSGGMPTPKMLRALGLALAVGSVAAGGVFFLVRVLQKPAPSRPPVVVNLEEPTPPLPVDPSDPVSPRRRRGKRGAVAPAATTSSPATSKPAPTSAPPATTPAPSTTAPSADPPPPRSDPPATKTAKTTPAPPPTQFIPTDTDEQVPPTEEELADEAKAAQFAEGIRFVARRYRNQIEACYERAFKQEASSPGGRIDISFTVNKEGRAKKIATIGNTTGKEQVGKCIEQLIGEWQFPRPPSGEFNTAYPFVFSGG